MEEYRESQQETQTSKYNSAVAQLYRLNALWEKSHELAMAGKYFDLKFTLDRVWIELASDASATQKELQKKHNALVGKYLSEWSKASRTHSVRSNKLRNYLYFCLQQYEIFLRSTLNSQGKGSAYQDDSEEIN